MSEHIIDVGDRHIKEVNEEMQEAAAQGKSIRVINTLSRHNLGVGLPDGAQLIHVKGDAGPRCGVAMKGGNIVVEGKIGYQSGFMAHSGKIIALGGAGASCADALWEGEVWVAGDVESLGVDVHVIEPTAEEVAEVDAILEPLGLVDSSRNWRKMISGQRLWYFESRDASAWLMI